MRATICLRLTLRMFREVNMRKFKELFWLHFTIMILINKRKSIHSYLAIDDQLVGSGTVISPHCWYAECWGKYILFAVCQSPEFLYCADWTAVYYCWSNPEDNHMLWLCAGFVNYQTALLIKFIFTKPTLILRYWHEVCTTVTISLFTVQSNGRDETSHRA